MEKTYRVVVEPYEDVYEILRFEIKNRFGYGFLYFIEDHGCDGGDFGKLIDGKFVCFVRYDLEKTYKNGRRDFSITNVRAEK